MFFAIMEIRASNDVYSKCALLFRAACVICLYVSFKKHNKNVMKGMMGSLLAMQLMSAFLLIPGLDTTAGYICGPVYLLLSLLLFVNHFIINSNHKASPVMISFNIIILVLLVINNAAWDCYFLFQDITGFGVLLVICDVIGFAGMTAAVVCVESRLDAYRLNREAAGWTEEKGYPEGYVHEYEKNVKK